MCLFFFDHPHIMKMIAGAHASLDRIQQFGYFPDGYLIVNTVCTIEQS